MDFYSALENGDSRLAEDLIRRRFHDNNHSAENDIIVVQIGSPEGHLDILKVSTANGADAKTNRMAGMTALHHASVLGDLEILKFLIANGADISATDDKDRTPLHLATNNGHGPVVELLIKEGADVNAASKYMQTPLINAAIYGHIDIAAILLRNGADITGGSPGGWTPLHYAARLGKKEMVKYLVEQGGADVFNRNKQGNSAATFASRDGRTDIVEYLVSKMPDEGMYSANESSRTNGLDPDILITAAQYGRMATVQKLVTSLGADPSHRPLGLNAEDNAHLAGHSDVVWFLNKSTEGRNRPSGNRPEMDSCKSEYGLLSREEMESESGDTRINLLNLEVGVFDLHFQDEEGMTHLHAAVKKKDLVVISLLLDQGALATALTYDGVTPIDLARIEGSMEAVILIERHLKKFIENELKSSSEKSHYYSILLSLILDCISSSTQYEDDDSKVEKEQQKVLKKASWLLSLGVPLEPPGNYHTHALHLAIISNCKRILTLLLAAGAPLYVTHDGMGPVQVAWLTPDVTTWVAVAVTRAVMHKLKAEVKGLKLCNVINWVLMFGIVHLVNQLDGEKPWQTKLSCLDKYLSVLLGAACEQGATLTAWWVWRAGGCCLFQRKKDGKTPLHMALDRKHYQTAVTLVQYMEANPFLPDNEGRLPIDVFPEREKDDVMMGSLVSEYRVLDGVLQRTIDSWQKREAKDMILLLLVMFSIWKKSQYKLKDDNSWMKLSINLISLLRNFDDVHDTQHWILKLNEKLEGINSAVQSKTKKPKAKYRENVSESRKDMTIFLHELDSHYYTDEESDSLAILMTLLETWVKQSLASGRTPPSPSSRPTASQKINDSYIKNKLLKKGLKWCTGMKLPMFLHLLVSIAKVNVRMIIDPITRTEGLHQAAMNGNMSAASFLLKNGASKAKRDRYGRTPSHYAYMHGHKTLGDSLNTHPEIASVNGVKPTDLWQAYTEYLQLYGVNKDVISKPELIECNDSDDLIQFHLKALNAKWSKRGLKEAVMEAKVDYTNGESFAVQDAIKQLLENLILEVGNLDSRFEAELVFVGSSADDVRLLTPDEYDCNVVFKNFSGYPDGGCQILLQDSLNTNKDIDIIVSTTREDLKDLFVERTLLVKFSRLIKKCLPKLSMDPKLSITLPSVKLTQVGVGLSFAWNGKEFPLLLIDVDVVPTMKAPWPPVLEKTRLLPDVMEVYLNTVGSNEWRFSSAQDEKRVMECLSKDERFVFLACKLAIASLKIEGWMLKQVKDQFKYWDGRMMKIPYPKGFLLKNSFFFEKEEVTDLIQWKEGRLLERMISIFKRMCHEMEKDNRIIFVPGKIPAYFGRSTEEQCVGFGVPQILGFLQDWQRSSSIPGRSVRPKAFAQRK